MILCILVLATQIRAVGMFFLSLTSNFSSKGERTNVLSTFCSCGIKLRGNKYGKLKGSMNEET